jgi:hypothetical protein
VKIDRHNYESFFILYLDNELPAEQRAELEAFVQLHPDLKEELDTLSQFHIEPELQSVFPNKEELFRHETLENINADNYESWLLMYVDHELNTSQIEMVEDFAAHFEPAKRELEALQSAVLLPGTISFAGKEQLYRRSTRRIAPVWYRMAAAILILAFGFGFFLLRKNNSHPTVPIAKTERHNRNLNESPKVRPSNNKDNHQTLLTPEFASNNQQKTSTGIPKQQNVSNTGVKHDLPVKSDNNPSEKNDAVLANNDDQKPSNNLSKPENHIVPANRTTTNAIASLQPEDINHQLSPALTNSLVTTTHPHSSDIRTAAVTTNDAGFTEDNNSQKKNSLRGLFRKITRTFEKRTNIDPTTDDNKLLVAGFSVSLK